MKRWFFIVCMVSACLMLQPARDFAVEQDQEVEAPKNIPEKDLCLLYLHRCSLQAQSIQDKISRLQEEIAKGTKVYDPEELRMLKEKLEDANRRLDLFFVK